MAHQIAANAGIDDQVAFLELLADLVPPSGEFGHRGILALFKQLALDAGESSAAETWRACAHELGFQEVAQDEIIRAQNLYAGTHVAVDDDALMSKADGGAWIQAWVWLDEDKPIELLEETLQATHEPEISTEPVSLTPDLSECVQELGYSFAAWQTAVGNGDDTESWVALARIRSGIRTIWNLKPPNKRQVVEIEIRGGIGEVTKCPDGVEVSIVDWDNLKVGACPFCDVNLPDFARYCPECGERFPSSLLWTR